MDFTENWVNNNGVKIHYIDNKVNSTTKLAILICPGLSESAKDYKEIMSNLGDRRCIALSFRGRGESDSPNKGYTLNDHISDIVAVVNDLKLKEFCLCGYSRGVSYALGYAILNPKILNGLIIGEYPAMHKEMPKGWAKKQMNFYKENCEDISIKYDVLKSIETESDKVNFKYSLNKIDCPFLLLKGEQEETLVTKEDILDYINSLNSKSIRIERFEKAGHAIPCEDFDGLIKVINEFLTSIDNN